MFDNICQALNHWAATTPDAKAIIEPAGCYTYKEFRAMVARRYDYLAPLIVARQGKGVVLIADLREGWITCLALRMMGLDTLVIANANWLPAMNIVQPACFVVLESEATQARNDQISRLNLAVIQLPLDETRRQGDAADRELALSRPLGGHILCTSGTTGRYKMVLLDAAGERDRNRLRAKHYALDQSTVCHILYFGLWTGIGYKHPSAIWSMGGAVVFDQSQEPYSGFFTHGTTTACLTIANLRECLSVRRHMPPPEKPWLICWGGGFLPQNLAIAAKQHLNATILIGYGATELAGAMLLSTYETLDDLIWYYPTDDRVVDIVDSEGRPCPDGVEGEFWARLEAFDAPNYLNNENISGSFFRNGWFFPGDLAVRREDGRIRILGRAMDVINLNGNKVAAAPHETEIQQILGVEEVCLFTALTSTGREEIVIAIQAPQLPERQKLEIVANKFGTFGHIRIELRSVFPKTTAGMMKTNRAELRKLLFS